MSTTLHLSYHHVSVPESGDEVIHEAKRQTIQRGFAPKDMGYYAALSVWLEDGIRTLVRDMQAMAREIERLKQEKE